MKFSPKSVPLLTLATVSLVSLAHPGGAYAIAADDDARYTLQVSRNEARESLLGLLDDQLERGARDTDADRFAMELVRSYRTLPRASTLALRDGPYIQLIIREKTDELFPSAYDSAWNDQYDQIVVHPQLEFLFDSLLSGYVDHSLPASIASQADRIGMTLAKKVIRGKGPSCALDPSENLDEPGFFHLLWIKITQYFDWPVSPCSARQVIYNAIKKQLIDARRQQLLKDVFAAQFPPKFREEFLSRLATQKLGFPDLVAKKFKAENDEELWGSNTPLVETEDAAPDQVSLREFARGLRADLAVAARFAQSRDPKERGVAAPLFYGAANRLLLLTGGKEAQWDGSQFGVVPGVSGVSGVTGIPTAQQCAAAPESDGCAHHFYNSRYPKAPPVYAFDIFGGWGVDGTDQGPQYSPWDWGSYDPTRSVNPSPFRIFPSSLTMGPRARPVALQRNVDVHESLGDLADLLAAVTDFLKATGPHGVFAQNFGDSGSLGSLLDPDSPVLFPHEGRALAVGIMAGVLKNLVAPNVGHLEMTQPGTAEGGLGLAFHDQVGLNGRDSEGASVLGVSKILMAASDLRAAMTGDPDVPDALQALAPQLDTAEQIGALTLAAQGQGPDGGFFERLRTPMTTGRSFGTTVAGLRSLTRAYAASQMLVLKLSIKNGWQFLDQLWGTGAIPHVLEGAGGQPVSPSLLWDFLRLWNETQRVVRSDLASDQDWAKWESRVNSLRQKLLDQLRAPSGPQPFGDMRS